MLDFSALPHYEWLDLPVWVFDHENHCCLWANAAALGLWRADSEAELLARDMFDISEGARLRLSLTAAAHARDEVTREQWTIYPKGKAVSATLVSRGIRTDDGRQVMLFTANPLPGNVDKTLLRGSDALQHTSMRVALFSLRGGKALMINPAAAAAFGLAGSATSVDFASLFADPGMASHIRSQIRHNQTFSGDLELFTTSGKRWHSLDVRPMRDPFSGRTVMQLNARDISDLKATQSMLEAARLAAEAASQAKSNFLAHMSHEIRTPMNGVLGLTELALQTELDARQRNFIDLAHKSAKGLMVIINDLLDVAKIETGRIQMEQRQFSLHDCLSESTYPLLLNAQERDISLQVRVQPAVADLLMGDALRLRQVLINLIGNALKFTAKGEVRVDVELLDELAAEGGQAACQRLRFSVHDTGIGMTPEQLEHIFEPFTQADRSVARRFGGTGLGLTIVQRLVRLMGSEVEVESVPDLGSCFGFELVLPLAGPGQTPGPTTQQTPSASAATRSGKQHA